MNPTESPKCSDAPPRLKPAKRLAWLTAAVLALHALALVALPARFSNTLKPQSAKLPTLSTRSIAAPAPPQQVAAMTPAPPKPVPKPAPKLAPKSPAAQVKPAVAAIESIAISAPIAAPAQAPAPEAVAAAPVAAASAPAEVVSAEPAPFSPAPPTASKLHTTLPPSFVATYAVLGLSKGLQYRAAAELTWRNSGSDYETSMKVSAFLIGARTMTSVGKITANGLAPTRFADKFRSEQAAHFDAEKGLITFSANTPNARWTEGAQDRVSVLVQLGSMLAAQPQGFLAGTTIAIYTAGPRDADLWTFTIDTEEVLDLPGGKVLALKLSRKPKTENDTLIEVWYAPSLGYLPVRNKITQANGDFVDQQLASAEQS